MSTFLKFIELLFGWLGGRPKLKVRISEDNPEKEVGGLTFEVENQAKKPSSLDPKVQVAFLTVKGDAAAMDFDVRELDRNLMPFQPKLFSASAKGLQPARFHGWFRVYVFRPSNGRPVKVRIRNAHLDEIGVLAFVCEKLWFQLTGLVEKGPLSFLYSALDDTDMFCTQLSPTKVPVFPAHGNRS